MKTYVISAFPGCGKSYCFKKYGDKFKILDSDSNKFSWTTDGEGITVRNKDFPNNYIKHIKDNIGKVDIIFVNSHKEVREALSENNIDAILIYPYRHCKTQWLTRFKLRGDGEKFIKFLSDNWYNFLSELENDKNGFLHVRLDENEYIDLEFLNSLFEKISITTVFANK